MKNTVKKMEVEYSTPMIKSTLVTVLNSFNNSSCNKVFSVDSAGNLKSETKPFFSGFAQTKKVDSLDDFKNVLEDISDNPEQCIILGHHYGCIDGDTYLIYSKKMISGALDNNLIKPVEDRQGWYTNGDNLITTRTKDLMLYSNITLFDKDNGIETIDQFEQWENKVDEIIPGFKQTEKVVKLSNSSRVKTSTEDTKWHCYVWVDNPDDLYDFGDRCLSAGYAKGHAMDEVGVKGQHLKRIIFDCAVFSPERIIYEGKPLILGDTNNLYPIKDVDIREYKL